MKIYISVYTEYESDTMVIRRMTLDDNDSVKKIELLNNLGEWIEHNIEGGEIKEDCQIERDITEFEED